MRRERMVPVGGRRRGVLDPGEFFRTRSGSPDGMLSTQMWLTLPEQSLSEAVNGEIFYDPSGAVSEIRRRLAYFPEDVRLKKLAGRLLLMHQAGLYNYPRILAHGETASAQLAVGEFAASAMAAVFLLNRRYRPFYKWTFRALRELPVLGDLADSFEYLLTTGNDAETVPVKRAVVEDICALILERIPEEILPRGSADKTDLESAAYAVNDRIADEGIRSLHILAGV